MALSDLIVVNHRKAAKADAQMFLFVVDGAMVQLLSGNKVDKGKLLEGWLVG